MQSETASDIARYRRATANLDEAMRDLCLVQRMGDAEWRQHKKLIDKLWSAREHCKERSADAPNHARFGTAAALLCVGVAVLAATFALNRR